MVKLALLSRSATPKPETFVQSHRDGIMANVFFYYGDMVPRYLDGYGLISIDRESLRKPWFIIKQVLTMNVFGFLRSGLPFFEYMLARSMKKNKIEVALAEYGDVSACVMDACKYAKIPLVAHFHGRDCSAKDVLKGYKSKYEQLFDYCPSIIVVSLAMKQKLISLGCSENKIVYSPCVPDEKFYHIEARLEKPQFFSIGRFVDKKAPYVTILAFKKIVEKHPEATLIIAGDGPLWPTCKNLVKILGLSERVFLPGVIEPEQTIKYLESSIAYVQHSITAEDGDTEGTPVAIMEASAAGLPVISTIHAGIPDIIIDGETGLLSKELDLNAMVNNMVRILEDKKLAINLGRNGKTRMNHFFTKVEQMNVLTDTVNKAANEHH